MKMTQATLRKVMKNLAHPESTVKTVLRNYIRWEREGIHYKMALERPLQGRVWCLEAKKGQRTIISVVLVLTSSQEEQLVRAAVRMVL